MIPIYLFQKIRRIPCSLDRKFISDLAGKLVCTVNSDIYSANGNVKLIEKGTAAHVIYKAGSFSTVRALYLWRPN
jgi:type IV secretory pathway VirB10-like protein